MKGKFIVKGLEVSFSVCDKVPTFTEAGVQTGVEMKEVAKGAIKLAETNDEIEMSDDEFKHIYTTVKEDLANLREVVIVPLMEKVFTVADNLTALADKKICSDIKIAEHESGMNDIPAA